MTIPVALTRCLSYDYPQVKRAVERLFELLPLPDGACPPGARVLVKPNLLVARHPDAAATTHPAVLRAVLEHFLDRGARPIIAERPGPGSFTVIAGRTGTAQVAKHLGVELRVFDSFSLVRSPEILHRHIQRPDLLDEADLVVTVAKAKTHLSQILTLAVKNSFGFAPLSQRFQWHLATGLRYDLLGRMILEHHLAMPVGLAMVDAIVAMEGRGPTGGTPREAGFLAASTDALALDQVLAPLFGGIGRAEPHTLSAARERGLLEGRRPDPVGEDPADLVVSPFQLPPSALAMPDPGKGGLAQFTRNALRSLVMLRPQINRRLCQRCGACLQACAAGAIDVHQGIPLINRDKCLCCFCCHEMCSYQAIDLVRGPTWLHRAMPKRWLP